MTSLMLLLISVIASAMAIPHRDILDNRISARSKDAIPVSTGTEIVGGKAEAKAVTRKQAGNIDGGTQDSKSLLLTAILNQDDRPDGKTDVKAEVVRPQKHHAETKEKPTKKGRKHKAIFVNYPLLPQIQLANLPPYGDLYEGDDADYKLDAQQRTSGHAGRYQESDIFYIRLPPTPYMFVPGLGYISQPPTYSTAGLRPQIPYVRPARPKPVYRQPVNPFINLPIDFVSNGKPTSVYQWQKKPGKKPTDSPITNLDALSADFVSNGKPTSIYQWQTNLKPIERPGDLVNKLDNGPYTFNGKPTSFFLLKSDGTSTGHQNIRYSNFQEDNSYY